MSKKECLLELSYLELHDSHPRLKRNDKYYYQVQMQLAVTGLPWCDFLVWFTKEVHLETTSSDQEFWNNVKKSVDLFFLINHI